MSDSPSIFARPTGLPPGLGKCNAELKTGVPDSVKEDFLRLAAEAGMEPGKFLRTLILTRLYGVEAVASMQVSEVLLAAGTGRKFTLSPVEAD